MAVWQACCECGVSGTEELDLRECSDCGGYLCEDCADVHECEE